LESLNELKEAMKFLVLSKGILKDYEILAQKQESSRPYLVDNASLMTWKLLV
jgi:hypothetical protein